MTEKKDFPVFRVGIVTLSDKGYQGEREDKSGPRIKELLPAEQYEVVSMRLLPDERAMIEEELIRLADLEQCDLVLTTGGTGFSMRDVTPEATLAVSGRVAPGIAEAIRAGSMAGDAEPGSECNPSSDADYQSAGKPEGGGRESWICT